jgi:hypothetical protein
MEGYIESMTAEEFKAGALMNALNEKDEMESAGE